MATQVGEALGMRKAVVFSKHGVEGEGILLGGLIVRYKYQRVINL